MEKIREDKKSSKKLIQQGKIKVIKLAWPVRSETDRIHSQSMIPQVDPDGVRTILCEDQSTGNDLYE
jgi:hypothetical protein